MTFWNNLRINLEQPSGRCQAEVLSASDESLTALKRKSENVDDQQIFILCQIAYFLLLPSALPATIQPLHTIPRVLININYDIFHRHRGSLAARCQVVSWDGLLDLVTLSREPHVGRDHKEKPSQCAMRGSLFI